MLSDGLSRRIGALGEVSESGKRANGIFRLLGHPSLWMQAFANIYGNQGAMTKGIDTVTMDGFSEDRALNLIELIKEGRYQFSPVRRVYIPKSNGKRRPLGITTGDDKLVQEAMRILLEAVYEPIFSKYSHGFRPGLSCHTALRSLRSEWAGTKWYVEVDIKGFFDSVNHYILLRLLEQKIDDKRFIKFVESVLKAGYFEDWKYYGTYSGTPQGGIISPLLSNIYLHELDQFMEQLMKEEYSGKYRSRYYYPEVGRVYRLRQKINKLKASHGRQEEINGLRKEFKLLQNHRRTLQHSDSFDPKFRRVRYCRYADDFLIGIIGSRDDALRIKEKVICFIQGNLLLEPADNKTSIKHCEKGVIFLGYRVKNTSNLKIKKKVVHGTPTSSRSMRGTLQLMIPENKLQRFCDTKGYGDYSTTKAREKSEWLNRSDSEIVMAYNAEMRGFANYYCLATSAKAQLSKLYFIWQKSLFASLARKHKSTTQKIATKLRSGKDFQLRYEVDKREFRLKVYSLKELKLKVDRNADFEANPYRITMSRTEVIKRLNANKCEYCGKVEGYFEVHHARKLKDLDNGKELWQRMMAQMKRKTLVLCIECHDDLHRGALPDWRSTKHG